MNPYNNNYNHNPHQRHPSQQNIPNYQRYNNNHSSSHYPRNQSHNNHHSHTYHNNNTYNEYNHSRHHRHHNRYNRHNHYSPNHYQNNNNYRNNNHNHSYNQPQPKHQIISQTTGPLIIQQKKQSEPYFYDPQRPIAKRAISNKSSILNNPVLDQTEKNRLITNDQIYAIQKEAQQLENEQYNYDTTNNLPCSPEPPDSETETDNENDNIPSDYDNDNENEIDAKNVKFGGLIREQTSIMDYTQHMEMLTDNNKSNNLLDNENNKDKFGIYTTELIHKQAMIIPDKHTLGDCINNAKIIKNNNYKRKRKNNRRRGAKNNKKNMDNIGMDKYDKDEWRIKMEVNAFGRFLDEAKEHTKKNIMKS